MVFWDDEIDEFAAAANGAADAIGAVATIATAVAAVEFAVAVAAAVEFAVAAAAAVSASALSLPFFLTVLLNFAV